MKRVGAVLCLSVTVGCNFLIDNRTYGSGGGGGAGAAGGSGGGIGGTPTGGTGGVAGMGGATGGGGAATPCADGTTNFTGDYGGVAKLDECWTRLYEGLAAITFHDTFGLTIEPSEVGFQYWQNEHVAPTVGVRVEGDFGFLADVSSHDKSSNIASDLDFNGAGVVVVDEAGPTTANGWLLADLARQGWAGGGSGGAGGGGGTGGGPFGNLVWFQPSNPQTFYSQPPHLAEMEILVCRAGSMFGAFRRLPGESLFEEFYSGTPSHDFPSTVFVGMTAHRYLAPRNPVLGRFANAHLIRGDFDSLDQCRDLFVPAD